MRLLGKRSRSCVLRPQQLEPGVHLRGCSCRRGLGRPASPVAPPCDRVLHPGLREMRLVGKRSRACVLRPPQREPVVHLPGCSCHRGLGQIARPDVFGSLLPEAGGQLPELRSPCTAMASWCVVGAPPSHSSSPWRREGGSPLAGLATSLAPRAITPLQDHKIGPLRCIGLRCSARTTSVSWRGHTHRAGWLPLWPMVPGA